LTKRAHRVPKARDVIDTEGGRSTRIPLSSGVNRVKVVISRKGVDSGKTSGGMASPILPCGCLCSIPIPYTPSDTRYADIWFGKRTLQQICNELNPRHSHEFAHLDPDLRPEALASRPKDWRPAFGQSGAAEGHLTNEGIGAGDLFIFFGWFRGL
jgi:hypothetical protein